MKRSTRMHLEIEHLILHGVPAESRSTFVVAFTRRLEQIISAQTNMALPRPQAQDMDRPVAERRTAVSSIAAQAADAVAARLHR
jgi:hypothetical protein